MKQISTYTIAPKISSIADFPLNANALSTESVVSVFNEIINTDVAQDAKIADINAIANAPFLLQGIAKSMVVSLSDSSASIVDDQKIIDDLKVDVSKIYASRDDDAATKVDKIKSKIASAVAKSKAKYETKVQYFDFNDDGTLSCTTYSSIQEALDDIETFNGRIVLADDLLSLSSEVSAVNGKRITIDLNGHTISSCVRTSITTNIDDLTEDTLSRWSLEAGIISSSLPPSSFFYVANGTKVLIENGRIDLDVHSSASRVFKVFYGAKLTLKSVDVEARRVEGSDSMYAFEIGYPGGGNPGAWADLSSYGRSELYVDKFSSVKMLNVHDNFDMLFFFRSQFKCADLAS